MGVNLVTIVRNFYIQHQTFTASDHDVQDGCVTPGNHRVMRFDFLSYNAGNADFVIGSPASRPDLFVWSSGHGHYHLKDFNEFLLFDSGGHLATIGYKQAFCAIDIERIRASASGSRFNNCNSDQGISAGWADVYNAGLPCQYIVIDGLPDGDYTLQSTTNAQHVAAEECFGDNTTWTGLRIAGDTVQVIEPPWLPEDRLGIDPNHVAAVEISGRWKVVDGDHWMIDTGSNRWAAERAVEIIKHYGLSYMCFVGRPRCGDVEPMMYFLNAEGHAPSGHVDDEDEIAFNPANLQVVQFGDRWKIVEGTHHMLDFGVGEANARAALHFIKKYAFNRICFIARPNPPMMYFKRSGHAHHRPIRYIDPRLIDLALDRPLWRAHQAAMVAKHTLELDYGRRAELPHDHDPGPRIEVACHDEQTGRVVTRHGITGLECDVETTIDLPHAANILDLELAHFGRAPSVRVLAADGEVVAKLDVDPRPRQVERLRAVAKGIRRVVIEPHGEPVLVVSVSAPPTGPFIRAKS
jgi:hypothetical protein